VSTIEELLGRKIAAKVYKAENTAIGIFYCFYLLFIYSLALAREPIMPVSGYSY
jgi:hypothetical protein